jgi:type IV pilus assembly protein PilB
MSQGEKRKMLGEILVESNQVLPEQLELALAKQRETGRRLGQVLLEMGFVSYETLTHALTEQTGVPHVWLRRGLIDPEIVNIIPREKAELYNVIPMFKVHRSFTVAMSDPSAIFAMDDLENLTGCQIQPVRCRAEDITAAISEYYDKPIEMDEFLESFSETDVEVVQQTHFQDLHMVEEMAEGARIINMVNLMLLNAVKERASDIHIEPDTKQIRVRYRIDGTLQQVMSPRLDLLPAIISRIKVMANMNIAERRMPQDGRIRVVAEGKDVDLRVSTMPTVLGEKVAIRLLDKSQLVVDINKLGFHPDTLMDVKRLLFRPHGIILVTGPTGSGKTTSLYAAIKFISTIEKNIVTIEDPVEYQLEVINQVHVNAELGLTFARVLRSVLRQDPDIIMVGEIRDRETAEVAIQAALTGHLVLATLHTNESIGAIARLLEMGIEPYLLTSTVIGVVAQRLVRLVCDECKIAYFPPSELLERIEWPGHNVSFSTGRGCSKCFDTGLRHRRGIFELLLMDETLRRTVLRNPSFDELREVCSETGMRTLKDEGFRLAEEGATSLDEVMRVVFVEEKARIAAASAA